MSSGRALRGSDPIGGRYFLEFRFEVVFDGLAWHNRACPFYHWDACAPFHGGWHVIGTTQLGTSRS